MLNKEDRNHFIINHITLLNHVKQTFVLIFKFIINNLAIVLEEVDVHISAIDKRIINILLCADMISFIQSHNGVHSNIYLNFYIL
jgi:hypothetical protein